MTEFFQWLMGFVREFRVLVTILPWEIGVRTRLGNRIAVWQPGLHIKLPFIDDVRPVNTRLRIAHAGDQTITTLDGKVLTVSMAIGFLILDPVAALLRLHDPEASCAALAQSATADFVGRRLAVDVKARDLEAHALAFIKDNSAGYSFEFARVTDFAYIRTYRILNEAQYRKGELSITDRII